MDRRGTCERTRGEQTRSVFVRSVSQTEANERVFLGNFVRSGRALFSFPYPYGIVLKLKLARKLAEIGKCLLTGAFSAT